MLVPVTGMPVSKSITTMPAHSVDTLTLPQVYHRDHCIVYQTLLDCITSSYWCRSNQLMETISTIPDCHFMMRHKMPLVDIFVNFEFIADDKSVCHTKLLYGHLVWIPHFWSTCFNQALSWAFQFQILQHKSWYMLIVSALFVYSLHVSTSWFWGPLSLTGTSVDTGKIWS